MASTSTPAAVPTGAPSTDTPQPADNTTAAIATPQPADPVEMNALDPKTDGSAPVAAAAAAASASSPSSDDPQPAQEQPSSTAVASASQPSSAPEPERPHIDRVESEAIGPSTDTPIMAADPSGGPVVTITLLLQSGARHPYKVDEKYLRKRNVIVDEMNPYNISVYNLKELIWRDWREDWEPRPASPSSIRLISFGRMLDDKQALKECRFQTESPNVVHMTIKPQEIIDDEDTKTGKAGTGRDGATGERSPGCRCVIL